MKKSSAYGRSYRYLFLLIALFLAACGAYPKLSLPDRQENAISGSAFYKQVAGKDWQARERLAVDAILSGNIPDFLRKFVRIDVSIEDSSGKKIKGSYFVLPDYVSIGANQDFARVPLTPMAAQRIADRLHCFLPTRKMVDAIYAQASVKLEPQPMYALRDSSVTFYQHHLIIEGQRKLRQGLIAGIKKDVILTHQLKTTAKPDRVAIYGWHRLNGKPIQPVYTGHVNWYVDYSHGIRFVYQTIMVNGKPMHYQDVLRDPLLSRLLCDEPVCDCFAYPY